MSDFPRMLYALGDESDDKLHGLWCKTAIIDSAAEEVEMRRNGWFRTPAEAHGGEPVAADDLEEIRDENAGLLQEIEELRKERDELKELMAAFDGDGDGKPGGRKPKAEKPS